MNSSHNVYLTSFEFSKIMVHENLDELKGSKPPGPDEINVSVLLNSADTLSQLDILMMQYFPSEILLND